jgi:hypothetical protein
MVKSLKRKLNCINEKKNNNICSICRNPPKIIGKMNSCNHLFCFNCIKKWSDQTNKCPLCKKRFTNLKKKYITPTDI